MSRPEVMLGELADATSQRDAIHIAVLPVKAGEHLYPSAYVRVVVVDGVFTAFASRRDHANAIGVVDPFLDGEKGVDEGQHCFVCLKPYTITSLRHEWTHPKLEAMLNAKLPDNAHDAAVAYITEIADVVGISYEAIMEGARRHCESEEYFHRGDDESYNSVDTRQWKKFWSHFHTLTGLTPPKDAGSFFSCAC